MSETENMNEMLLMRREKLNELINNGKNPYLRKCKLPELTAKSVTKIDITAITIVIVVAYRCCQ